MADPKNYTNRPFSIIDEDWGYTRDVDLYLANIYDVLTGSGICSTVGDFIVCPNYELMIQSASGSGPYYNVDLTYNGKGMSPGEGLTKPRIGDKLLVIDNPNPSSPESPPLNVFRYDITDIINSGINSAKIEVKYVSDSDNSGDENPQNLHAGYDDYGYGPEPSYEVNAIVREFNPEFLLHD